MAKRTLSLNSKIYIFSSLIFLFTIAILLIIYFYYSQFKKIESNIEYVRAFTNQLNEIQIAKNQILANYQSDKNSTQAITEDNNQQILSAQDQFHKNFSHFSSGRIYRKNIHIAQLSDSLKKSFEQYFDNIQTLLDAIQQRGTRNSGEIAALLSGGEDFLNSVSGYSPSVQIKAMELNSLIQKQVYERDPVLKDPIIIKIDELKAELMNEDSEIDFISILESISATSIKVANLDAYVGFTKVNSGLIAKQNASRYKFLALNKAIEYDLTKIIEKKKIRLILFFVFTILLVISLVIFPFIRESLKFVITPLHTCIAILNDLIKGKFSDKQIDSNSSYELSLLSDNIKKLKTGLKDKIEFAHNLNKGEYSSSITLLSNEDVLGLELQSLQKNIRISAEERKKYDDENAKRRYINEGLAKFSEITHSGYDKIEKLTDTFIRELTKYLNSLLGGVFLLENENEKEPALILSSAFAYNRKKYLTKSIPLGIGLVGTCALEKKMINLTEIPEDYMLITSGLGDAPPQNLLLIPMLLDDKVLGVIEVASLEEYKDYQIEFLKQVAISLASTITATKTNERTSKLLAQSQQYAQEMAEQEEEMRQNMEELKATQEESERREEEFKGVVEALSLALFVSEFDLNGDLVNINEKFLIYLGKKREDVLGRSFKDLVNGTNSSEINEKFFEELHNGVSLTLHDKIKIAKNKESDLLFQFSAILNKDSLPVKYLCLGVEIK